MRTPLLALGHEQEGALIEYSFLAPREQDRARLTELLAKARAFGATPEEERLLRSQTRTLAGFLLGVVKEEAVPQMTKLVIAHRGVVEELGDGVYADRVTFKRSKPVPIESLVSINIPRKITEYELRSAPFTGVTFHPEGQEYGVLVVVEHPVLQSPKDLAPSRILTPGYQVGTNQGRRYIRVAAGYRTNPLFLDGKQDFPNDYMSIQTIPCPPLARSKFAPARIDVYAPGEPLELFPIR